MKNYLTLVLALSVVSSPAFASRARLESLGEGKNGSYYIDDSRNMFLNPASIVRYKKKMMLELGGNNQGDADGVANADSRPQGGFTNTFGDFTYALYLNNTSDRAINTLGSVFAPSDALEFALAGEGSVNWGVSVLHGGNRAGADYSRYWAARFGVEKDAIALFGTIGIDSKAFSNSVLLLPVDEVKGNTSIDLGATYKMDEMTIFGKFLTTKATWTNAGTTANEGKTTAFGIGAGWKKEMTKSTNMFVRVEADSTKTENSNPGNNPIVASLNVSAWNVPVVLAAETQAMSWLAIRGSISHSLLGQNLLTQEDLANLTTVSAGIGMTFGDLVIDGMVATGATPAAFNTTDNIGFGTGANSGSSFGFGDNMISRIGLTYNF